MAQTFNNGESNASVRAKLNANATELNSTTAASTNASSLTTGTLPDARLSANIPKKVDGLILTSDLPNALLSPDQFEMLPNGTIGIKTSYLESLGLGRLPTPTAPTVTVSGRNVSAIHPSYPNQLEYSINNAAFVNYVDAMPINAGVNEVLANYYRFRVKASSGINNAGTIAGNPYIASESGSYVVENTIIANFSSEFAGPATNPPFNTLNPPSADIQTINGYTSPLLENTSGVESAITLTNSGGFAGQVAMISASQDAVGNTGVFENSVVNTAWTVNGGTSAALTIAGLNASKFYQLYFLMPTDNADSVRGVTINSITRNRTATTVLGSFGQAANGLNDAEWIVFNNITGVTSVSAQINRVSGDYGANLACLVLEQSNIAKP